MQIKVWEIDSSKLNNYIIYKIVHKFLSNAYIATKIWSKINWIKNNKKPFFKKNNIYITKEWRKNIDLKNKTNF